MLILLSFNLAFFLCRLPARNLCLSQDLKHIVSISFRCLSCEIQVHIPLWLHFYMECQDGILKSWELSGGSKHLPGCLDKDRFGGSGISLLSSDTGLTHSMLLKEKKNLGRGSMPNDRKRNHTSMIITVLQLN